MSDGLNVQTLRELQEKAVIAAGAAGKVQVIKAPELGAGKSLIVGPSGAYEIWDRVDVRGHMLGDVQAVIDWAIYSASTLEANPVLWLSYDMIRIVPDDQDSTYPRPVIYYPLQKTREFELVQRLSEAQQARDQKAFIRFLRSEFWDCLNIASRDSLIKCLKELNFSNNTSGTSKSSGGRQSMGMDIEEEVRSAVGTLPDEIVLNIRLFKDSALSTRQRITCDLETEVGTKPMFSLVPIKSHLDEALELELSELQKLLAEKLPKGTPIFRGTYRKADIDG